MLPVISRSARLDNPLNTPKGSDVSWVYMMSRFSSDVSAAKAFGAMYVNELYPASNVRRLGRFWNESAGITVMLLNRTERSVVVVGSAQFKSTRPIAPQYMPVPDGPGNGCPLNSRLDGSPVGHATPKHVPTEAAVQFWPVAVGE